VKKAKSPTVPGPVKTVEDVEVTGAGTEAANGYYKRMPADAYPRTKVYYAFGGKPWNLEEWEKTIDGRPWYQKDDGSIIYYEEFLHKWCLQIENTRKCGGTCVPYWHNSRENKQIQTLPMTGWRKGTYGERGVPQFTLV